jgi:hypothetical protein
MYERMSKQREVTPTRRRICTQTSEYQKTHFDLGVNRIYEKPESTNRSSYGVRNATPTRLPQDIMYAGRDEPRFSLNQEARDYNPRGSYTPTKGGQSLHSRPVSNRNSIKEYVRMPETTNIEKTDYITTKNLYHGGQSARIVETENPIPQSVLELQRTRNNQFVTTKKQVVNLDRGARTSRLMTEAPVVTDRDLWNQRLYSGHGQGGSKLMPKNNTNKNTPRSRTPF